jgi:ubiquinone/menaquinone biosynthesis C-methylase UbiE/glycosyltransferase involved in cell wall biosynthesis
VNAASTPQLGLMATSGCLRPETPLEFTDKRMASIAEEQIDFEHYHRYCLTRDLCEGRDVLDVASGEGYGAALLAGVARSVSGLEIDASSVAHAETNYRSPNLRFLQGDALALPLPDASVDVVVSFKTLEHLANHQRFISEVRRVLRPSGLFVVGTPDRAVYSAAGAEPNPYPILELTNPEFRSLLQAHFAHVSVLAQRPVVGSLLAAQETQKWRSYERRGSDIIEATNGLARCRYLLAVATDDVLPEIASSVYLDCRDGHEENLQLQNLLADSYKKDWDLGEEAGKKTLEFGEENARLREQVAQLKMVQEILRESLLDADNKIEDLRGAAVQRRLDADNKIGGAAVQRRLVVSQQKAAEYKRTAIPQHQNEAAERDVLLQEILNSTSWRIAGVIRMVGRRVPKLARAGRKILHLPLQNDAAERVALLQEILNSTSWRIAAPIRMVGRLFPKLARAGRKILRSIWRVAYKTEEPTAAQGSQFVSVASVKLESVAQESQFVSVASVKLESVARFSLLQSTAGKRLILVAADAPPMFDQQSGALRLYTMMRILFEAGWRLAFASEMTRASFNAIAGSAVNRKRYESRLREIGVEKIAYGREEINALLEAEGSGIRWALLSFPGVAHNLIPWIKVHAPWASIIYDMVDFHYIRMTREADLKSDEVIRSSALQMRKIEIANARTSDVTIAVSEDERQAVLKLDPSVVVKVVPNIFEIPADSDPKLASRKNLLFVGGFAHIPNIDAVQWFVEQVWPLIHQKRPNLKFIIAGSAAPQGVLNLAKRPGVEVVGYVEDLTPLFRRARVFVAPLRYGAGVKGKVGQSMAQGLPIVATRIAAEGMNAVGGKDLLIADEPAAFAAVVIRLLDDDPLWLQLRENGRELVRQTQSIEVTRIKLGNILNG